MTCKSHHSASRSSMSHPNILPTLGCDRIDSEGYVKEKKGRKKIFKRRTSEGGANDTVHLTRAPKQDCV